MNLHFCFLSKDCRQFGTIWRINLRIGRLRLAVALRPQDKFARTNFSTWLDWRYKDRWRK